jgi:putative Ca2+/H+ antiporter (TMEM165/GDT1 family)
VSAALAAFLVVFVAELGDRTQLLIVSMAARHRAAPVFGGLALGYALANLLSVIVGSAVGAALPERATSIIGGLLFLGFAAWTLLSDDATDDNGVRDPSTTNAWRLMLSLAATIMVSEIGDKSMLATATLAADGEPIAVWVGATAGVITAGALGVAAGRLLTDRIKPDVMRRCSAGLFTLFGLLLLARAF